MHVKVTLRDGMLPSNKLLGGSFAELSSRALTMTLARRFFPGVQGHSARGQGVCAGVCSRTRNGRKGLACMTIADPGFYK